MVFSLFKGFSLDINSVEFTNSCGSMEGVKILVLSLVLEPETTLGGKKNMR